MFERSTDIWKIVYFRNIDLIQAEAIRYAIEIKNIPNYTLSHEDLKVFIGFSVYSSYYILSSEKAYWSECEDLEVPLVKKSRVPEFLCKFKIVIHFTCSKHVKKIRRTDPLKLDLLMNKFNENCNQCEVFQTPLHWRNDRALFWTSLTKAIYSLQTNTIWLQIMGYLFKQVIVLQM